MNSFKVGILITGATESQVKRNLKLVRVLIALCSCSDYGRNTVEERRVEHLRRRRLINAQIAQLHRRAVNSTLSNVSSDDRRSILILSEGSTSSLVGRTISANVIESGCLAGRNTVTVPSIHSHDTRIRI